ncbi:uncharacterized protein MYCFIDRAFT_179674 [Pseudocercospora fijiensis CIRAD86]|uniref:Uncharacterized protein n=1 Tax=Pseudocercospora fijiensis (strain CIRAD86) TaxID=383855 RepID=M3AJ14_PSEFD|nr:uncharacterized protein MYCFIDRAFT_179674 [Pseudocercospora fijiensis CIRAD86]EME77472.1 hypothetical protein MYCFIDRAFT_179674 [Pseudocercospora fijiensis CIRAD86]
MHARTKTNARGVELVKLHESAIAMSMSGNTASHRDCDGHQKDVKSRPSLPMRTPPSHHHNNARASERFRNLVINIMWEKATLFETISSTTTIAPPLSSSPALQLLDNAVDQVVLAYRVFEKESGGGGGEEEREEDKEKEKTWWEEKVREEFQRAADCSREFLALGGPREESTEPGGRDVVAETLEGNTARLLRRDMMKMRSCGVWFEQCQLRIAYFNMYGLTVVSRQLELIVRAHPSGQPDAYGTQTS